MSFLMDSAIAKVQKEVGQFLILKDTLMRLQSHPSPSIASDAAKLMSTQIALEADLTIGMDTITKVQAGSWSYSDLLFLGSLAYNMETQIKDVSNLSDSTKRSTTSSGDAWQFSDIKPYLPYVPLAYIGLRILKVV